MNSPFENLNPTDERFLTRLQGPAFRVKTHHWFTPEAIEEDGNRLVFSAVRVASRLGNGQYREQLREHRDAQIALTTDTQGLYYKSTIGLLAIGEEVRPVRLETLGPDSMTGVPIVLPSIQQALIRTRDHTSYGRQFKFV